MSDYLTRSAASEARMLAAREHGPDQSGPPEWAINAAQERIEDRAEAERLRALLQRAVDAIAALEGDEIMYSKALVLSGVHTDAIAALAAEGSDEAPHDGPCAA